MERTPLPHEIRELAGIYVDIDHRNRNQLLPRYATAKAVMEMGGLCQQFDISDEPCVTCRTDAPEERLCVRYKILRNGTINTSE